MAGDANVASLQNQLNRFSKIAGFASLSVDGVMGPNTGQAILKALAWVSNTQPEEEDTAAGLALALVNTDGSINYTQMSTSAYGLATFLGQIADANALSRPSTNIYPVASGGTPAKNPNQVLNTANAGGASAVGANLWLGVKNLPTWAKVAGGVSVALVSLATYQHAKEKHKTLSGFLGFATPPRRRRRSYAR